MEGIGNGEGDTGMHTEYKLGYVYALIQGADTGPMAEKGLTNWREAWALKARRISLATHVVFFKCLKGPEMSLAYFKSSSIPSATAHTERVHWDLLFHSITRFKIGMRHDWFSRLNIILVTYAKRKARD